MSRHAPHCHSFSHEALHDMLRQRRWACTHVYGPPTLRLLYLSIRAPRGLFYRTFRYALLRRDRRHLQERSQTADDWRARIRTGRCQMSNIVSVFVANIILIMGCCCTLMNIGSRGPIGQVARWPDSLRNVRVGPRATLTRYPSLSRTRGRMTSSFICVHAPKDV